VLAAGLGIPIMVRSIAVATIGELAVQRCCGSWEYVVMTMALVSIPFGPLAFLKSGICAKPLQVPRLVDGIRGALIASWCLATLSTVMTIITT